MRTFTPHPHPLGSTAAQEVGHKARPTLRGAAFSWVGLYARLQLPFVLFDRFCKNHLRSGRWICCFTAVLLVAAPLPAQDDPPAAVDEAISLPPFYVEPPSRPDRWMLIEAPGFQLLTTNDSDYGRSFARRYFQQLALVRAIVPDRYQWKPYDAAQLIVVGTKSKRQATDEAMREALARVARESRDRKQTNASARRHFIPNMRLGSADSSVVFAFQDAVDRPDAWNNPFNRNGIPRLNSRWSDHDAAPGFSLTTSRLVELLRLRTPALPAWLIAGVAGVYEHCNFTDTTITFAPLPWRSEATVDALRLDPDTPRELLVLPALFAAPPPDDPLLLQPWREQAALFFHWALFSDEGRHRDAFWRFVDRLELDPPSDTVFTACFGFGLAEARDRLSAYLPTALTAEQRIEVDPKTIEQPELTAHRASPQEAGLIRGEWERLETGYVRLREPALTELYLDRARATVHRARESGDSPALQALAGLIEYEAGELTTARRELESAVLGGIRRPTVLQALARLRFDELRAAADPAPAIPAEHIGSVRVLLDAALTEKPIVAETYAQLAELWLNSDVPLTREHLIPLAEGARQYPYEPAVIVRMAALQANRGQLQSALHILNYASQRSRTQRTTEIYQRMIDQINAALPATP